MKKRFIIFTFIITILFVFPVSTMAMSFDQYKEDILNSVYILEGEIENTDQVGDLTSGYNQNHSCNTLLGSTTDENSVAWLLQKILNYIQILGPLLVVILSSIDFAQVIIHSDDDALAKAKKKLVIRLVLALALFFIPYIVKTLLNVFGLSTDATCGLG